VAPGNLPVDAKQISRSLLSVPRQTSFTSHRLKMTKMNPLFRP